MKNKFKIGQWIKVPKNFPLRQHRGHLVEVIKIENELITLRNMRDEFVCREDEIGAKRAMSTQERWEIMNRDRFRCQLCGRRAGPTRYLVLDHRQSFHEGGKTSWDNLWTVCTDCNAGKGSESIHEHWTPPRVTTTELNDAERVLNLIEELPDVQSNPDFKIALEVVRRAFEELHGM